MSKKFLVLFFSVFFLISSISTVFGETDIELTEEETEYIREHNMIVTGVDPEFAPYEFIDTDDVYKGIVADYLKLIEVKTGLHFNVQKDLSWEEAYDMALDGEIQVLPCVGKTQQRQEVFLFSDVYLQFDRALFSNNDDINYTFSNMNQGRVGVQRNSSHYSYLISETEIEPLLYSNNKELLLALSAGEIDVAVTNYAAGRYEIVTHAIPGIKVDDIKTMKETGFAVAVTNDDEILMSIINKGVRQITEEEFLDIQSKWMGTKKPADYSLIIRYVMIGGGCLGFILLLIIYWNHRLRKEINLRKKAEVELKTAKLVAEDANAAKSIFLARMSHEIRTPLNAISGLAYLLENTKTSAVQKKYIKNLKGASYNLLSVVNDILDFSKIEAGEMELEFLEFSLDAILDRISSILMPKANEKGIKFHIIKDVKMVDTFIGDPTRLEQILINLVNNAIKFTHDGYVRIMVKLEEELDDIASVEFLVEDTGIGISHEQQEYLFVPFHQLDSSITRNYGGTGLGLSITKNLVSRLGGLISVKSSLGKGSQFCVQLPMKIVKTSAKTLIPDLKNKGAIIYEEDPVSRKLIIDYMSAYQMKVEPVKNLESIVEAIQLNPDAYHMLIIDLLTKNGNSMEVIRKVKEYGLHVIILAKKITETEYEIAESLGVNHIILKPVISSILYNSIIQCFKPEIEEDVKHNNGNIQKVQTSHVILLVEDNEVNQMIEKEILEQKGFTVLVADNGKQAVDIVEEEKTIELILMDIHMPVMDGYEATRKIRDLGHELPILAMTAVSYANIEDECLKVGMDGYVTKPVEPDELFTTLEKHIHDNDTVETANVSKTPVEKQVKKDYIDVKQGLSRIGNNEKLYHEVVSKFYQDMFQVRNKVSNHYRNREFTEAKALVHKVKGCSGNIGALDLFQSSKLLNDALGSSIEVDLSPYLTEFEHDLTETIDVCCSLLSEWGMDTSCQEIIEYEENVLNKNLEELVGLLEKSDLDALKLFNEIKVEIDMEDDRWKEILALIEAYQFKKAGSLIRQIINQ